MKVEDIKVGMFLHLPLAKVHARYYWIVTSLEPGGVLCSRHNKGTVLCIERHYYIPKISFRNFRHYTTGIVVHRSATIL